MGGQAAAAEPGATVGTAQPRAAVGIFAHNEQATIGQVVEGFLNQTVSSAALCDVVVVCCGCTDDTLPIAREIAARDPRVRLMVRPRREGKVSAINEFLGVVNAELLVLSGADVVPTNNAVELLLSPLVADKRCMMTGPRVVMASKLSPPRAVDRLHDLLWSLHHAVALQRPKLGELVAIRQDVLRHRLPPGIHCDEALMESMVAAQGGRMGYVADALVYNFAPTSVRELYQQRRRIAAQHEVLQRLRGYRPSTTDPQLIMRALRTMPGGRLPLVLLLILLEAAARLHGHWDVHCGRSYQLWRIARPRSRDGYRLADMPVSTVAEAESRTAQAAELDDGGSLSHAATPHFRDRDQRGNAVQPGLRRMQPRKPGVGRLERRPREGAPGSGSGTVGCGR
ncbi:MAG TPA: glycosyltransferase [Streptosporangiaceae bacterium]|nr:glycosyltransferase [Streptosporangiaceae bacterium]